MESGFAVRITYWDDDIQVVEVTAANQHFSGIAQIYLPEQGLEPLIGALAGFPTCTRESRQLRLGESGAGVLSLALRTRDSRGSVEMEVQLEPRGRVADGHLVRLRLAVEPAAIDEFVQRMRSMPRIVGSTCRIDDCG